MLLSNLSRHPCSVSAPLFCSSTPGSAVAWHPCSAEAPPFCSSTLILQQYHGSPVTPLVLQRAPLVLWRHPCSAAAPPFYNSTFSLQRHHLSAAAPLVLHQQPWFSIRHPWFCGGTLILQWHPCSATSAAALRPLLGFSLGWLSEMPCIPTCTSSFP